MGKVKQKKHPLPIPRIVYLFGAGATHAEMSNLKDEQDSSVSKIGLSISEISERVSNRVRNLPLFKNSSVKFSFEKRGSRDIELLISLVELNRSAKSDRLVRKLKDYVESDIEKVLTTERKNKFFLHRALFELHKLAFKKEKLAGVISLNYDNVLDEAFEEFFPDPDYSLTQETKNDHPILKLHGSFSWKRVELYGVKRDIPILPLGINKNYLAPPYNFIWGRAYDVLANCDVLRVIGCSLNKNDIGLVDLLFKIHLEKGDKSPTIEIIDFLDLGRTTKVNYGFFPKVRVLDEIEKTGEGTQLVVNADAIKLGSGRNPFQE